MNSKFVIISFSFLITLILFSCAPKPSIVLADISCLPPCWKRIYPGKSTPLDVLSILQALPEVDQSSIRDESDTPLVHSISWSFTDDVGDYGGRIAFQNGKVSVIGFLHKEGAVTVSDAIEKFGPPENVLALLWQGERTWLTINLLYPSKGYILLIRVVPFHHGDRAEIKPEQIINDTWYIDPSLFEQVMTSGPIDRLSPAIFDEGLQTWRGFGEIAYIDR